MSPLSHLSSGSSPDWAGLGASWSNRTFLVQPASLPWPPRPKTLGGEICPRKVRQIWQSQYFSLKMSDTKISLPPPWLWLLEAVRLQAGLNKYGGIKVIHGDSSLSSVWVPAPHAFLARHRLRGSTDLSGIVWTIIIFPWWGCAVGITWANWEHCQGNRVLGCSKSRVYGLSTQSASLAWIPSGLKQSQYQDPAIMIPINLDNTLSTRRLHCYVPGINFVYWQCMSLLDCHYVVWLKINNLHFLHHVIELHSDRIGSFCPPFLNPFKLLLPTDK